MHLQLPMLELWPEFEAEKEFLARQSLWTLSPVPPWHASELPDTNSATQQ